MASKATISAGTEAYLLAQMDSAKAQSNNFAYDMLAQRLSVVKGAKIKTIASHKDALCNLSSGKSSAKSSPAASPRSTSGSSTSSNPSTRPRVIGLPRSLEQHMKAGAAQRVPTKQVQARPQEVQHTPTTSTVPTGKSRATSRRKAAPEKPAPVAQKPQRRSVWERLQWPSEQMQQALPPIACPRVALPLTEANLRMLGQVRVSPVPCVCISGWPADVSYEEWPTPNPEVSWMDGPDTIARPRTPPPQQQQQQQKIGSSACSSPTGSSALAPSHMTVAEGMAPALQPAAAERELSQLQDQVSPQLHECCKGGLPDKSLLTETKTPGNGTRASKLPTQELATKQECSTSAANGSSCTEVPEHTEPACSATKPADLHSTCSEAELAAWPLPLTSLSEESSTVSEQKGNAREGFLLGCIPARVQSSIGSAITAAYCSAGVVAAMVEVGSRLLSWR